METTADGRPSPDRGVLLGSVFVIGFATAAGFGRVFAGAAPTGRLVVAALLSVGIATALRRRSLLISLGVSAAALFMVVGILVYPQTLWFGVPAMETFEAIARALDGLGADAAREVAPAPPLRSLMTASLFAVWAATTAAHALAIRARSPVLALVPGAVLVAFAGIVTAEGARPVYAALYLVAAFGVLFGASIERLALWGPIVERPGRHRLGGGTTGRWARRLGLVASIVAVAIPGVLPGYGATPIVTMDPERSSRVSINPIVDIRPTLLQQPAAELFVVTADRPAYWRMLSLDRFDGRAWTSSDFLVEDGSVVGGTTPFGGSAVARAELQQTFEIRSLSVPWLPAAYVPVEASFDVDGDGGSARWDPDSAVLAVNDGTHEGDTYSIRSELVRPTPRQLDRAYLHQTLVEQQEFLQLPELPDELTVIAEDITEGQRTPFREALAIQEHLRSFSYDTAAPAGHDVDDILFFLKESQRGYCEQFAGTMAVLLRLLDIPARVAVGFVPGTRLEDGRWLVTTQDAHAWVEAYFPTYGWIAFEPTPTRSNPVARSYLLPPLAGRSDILTAPREGGRAPRRDPSERAGQQDNERAQGGAAVGTETAPAADPDRGPWPLWAIVLTVAATAALALALSRTMARRLALTSARSPADRVVTAYRIFEAAAADVGAGRRRGETLSAYRDRLGPDLLREAEMEHLTSLSVRAAYSPRPPGKEDAADAVAASRTLTRALHRRVGVIRATLGAMRLAPAL